MYSFDQLKNLRKVIYEINSQLVSLNKYIYSLLLRLVDLTGSENLKDKGVEDVEYIVKTLNISIRNQHIMYNRIESFRRLCYTYDLVFLLDGFYPFNHVKYGIYKYYIYIDSPFRVNIFRSHNFIIRENYTIQEEIRLIKKFENLPYIKKRLYYG
jgi:hypothetical protein